jgi:hypothetical protein
MLKFDLDLTEIDGLEPKMKAAVEYGQYVMDNQVLKDSNYFIPMDLRDLEKSGFLHSKLGQGKIMWKTPYAARLYYNPQYNFSKDMNPNAQGLWFEAAKARFLDKWKEQIKVAMMSKL